MQPSNGWRYGVRLRFSVITLYSNFIEATPDMALSVNDTLRKAERHAKKGEVELAAEIYRSVLEEFPENKRAADGLKALAATGGEPPQDQVDGLLALYNQKIFKDVLSHGAPLVKQFPEAAVLQTLMGAAHAGLGEADQAVPYYTRALEISPDSADVHNNLAAALLDLGSYEEAVGSLRRALEIQPDFPVAHNNLGNALRRLGRSEEALASFETALQLAPDYAEAHNNQGIAFRGLGRLKQATKCFGNALAIAPGFAIAHNNLGNTLRELGKVEEAVTCFESAVQIAPQFVEAHNNLGNALSDLGRRDEAVASFRKALELKPDFAGAHRNLSLITEYEPGDAQIELMLGLVERDGLPDEDRMQLCFALGKAHEDLGEWDKAFEFLAHANRIAKEASEYSIADDADAFSQILSWFPPQVPAIDVPADVTTTPVFIVGMPRSGTTLVEQILASHSLVHGAGELSLLERSIRVGADVDLESPVSRLAVIRETYLNALAEIGAAAPHVTDKMPLNFRWIGFICTAMPEARIVHIERDPRATCWSIFKHHFPLGGHGFANDLHDLAEYYKLYRNMMAFWRKRFPGRIYDLKYEALTENQEDETRRLLEYVGLPWEDGCLEFHTTRRVVQTSSASQVREGMYQGSSEAWRKYEEYLGPLHQAFEDAEG